jgi:cell division control protein 7
MGYDRMSHVMIPNSKSISPTTKTLHAVYRETPKGSKSNLDPKNLKRKALGQAKVCKDLVSLNAIKSQGADGSGITSAKDVTSTRTPSTERRREPIPRQGRKELISLLQEAMRSPNYKASSVPAPMRKRVAASPRQVESNLFYITPMPLHSTVIDVAGAGSIKKKGV